MKKLIFLFALCALPLLATAQTYKTVVWIQDSTVIASDTVDIAVQEMNYGWTLDVETWSLDAADATVTIYVSDIVDGPWVLYNPNSILTLSTATGLTAFEDDRLLWKYMRLVIDAGSCTSGSYEIRLQRIRRS